MKEEKLVMKAKGSGSTYCLLNDGKDEPQFIDIGLEEIVMEIILSGHFVIALTRSNVAYGWGTFGQALIKQPLILKESVIEVRCGWDHALFKTQSSLFGMGNNAHLELGVHPQIKFFDRPIIVLQAQVSHFQAGFRQSYAIIDSALFACGDTRSNQFGISSKKPLVWTAIIKDLSSLVKWPIQRIKASKRCLFIKNSEGLYGLGCNDHNICNLEKACFQIPTLLFAFDVISFDCGWSHLLIHSKEGVISAGRNNFGQLGTTASLKPIGETQQQSFLSEDIVGVVAGTEFSFVITKEGTLFGWGWNEHQNLINSSQHIIQTPTYINTSSKCRRVWTNAAITFIQCEDQSKQ